MKKKGLGRGMSALIPEKKENEPVEGVFNIPVGEISPNRHQPRTVFHQESLKELAESIRQRGVIQPVIVSRKRDGYELVAGERRWRAVKKLGYKEIPAIVKIIRDSDALELALIENIQRENLNPIEEAHAYDRLMREYAITQEDLSRKVGKSRPAIANFLRLLRLPDLIKDDLADGRLSMGHARALLSLDTDADRLRMRDQIVNSGMNVRETEQRSRASSSRKSKRKAPPADIFLEKVRLGLERKLGVRVGIRSKTKNRGTLHIHYESVDELNRVLDIIG